MRLHVFYGRVCFMLSLDLYPLLIVTQVMQVLITPTIYP